MLDKKHKTVKPVNESLSNEADNSTNPIAINSVRRSIKNIINGKTSTAQKEDSLYRMLCMNLATVGNIKLADLLFAVMGIDGQDTSDWDKYSAGQMKGFLKSMAKSMSTCKLADLEEEALQDEAEPESLGKEDEFVDQSNYISKDEDWDAHYSKEAVRAAKLKKAAELEGLPEDIFETSRQLENIEAIEQFIKSPGVKAAAQRMGYMFTPGKNFPNEANAIEQSLAGSGATVAVKLRYTQGPNTGKILFWASVDMDPIRAYKQLVTLRKAKGESANGKAIMTVVSVWFTDKCLGKTTFQQEFLEMRKVPIEQSRIDSVTGRPYVDFADPNCDKDLWVKNDGTPKTNQAVIESFKNSGTMIRLARYDGRVMAKLMDCVRLSNIIFGSKFDFDKQTDTNQYNAKLTNWNFINCLTHMPVLARIIVDKDHPDFYTNDRFDMIRRTPINLDVDNNYNLSTAAVNKNSLQYIADRNDIMYEYDGIDEVLWFSPSTFSTDNTGVTVYDEKGGKRKIKTAGSQPGRFVVPEGIKAINPYCFGFVNDKITTLVLPSTLEVFPPFIFSTLPNLKTIENMPQDMSNIPAGMYMNNKAYKADGKLEIPGDIVDVDYGAFAGLETEQVIFENPDNITSIGDCAFMYGTSNPLQGENLNKELDYYKHKNEPTNIYGLPGEMKTNIIGKLFFEYTMGCDCFNIGNYKYKEQKIIFPAMFPEYDSKGHIYYQQLYLYPKYQQMNINITDAMTYCNNNIEYTNILQSNNLSVIGNNAFWGCHKLAFPNGDLIIPDTVTYIGDCAFGDCLYRTRRIVLPKDIELEQIGDMAFCLSYPIMSYAYFGINEQRIIENNRYKRYVTDRYYNYYNRFQTNPLDLVDKMPAYATGNKNLEMFYTLQMLAIELYKANTILEEIIIPKAFQNDHVKFYRTFGYTVDTVTNAFGIKITYI